MNTEDLEEWFIAHGVQSRPGWLAHQMLAEFNLVIETVTPPTDDELEQTFWCAMKGSVGNSDQLGLRAVYNAGRGMS